MKKEKSTNLAPRQFVPGRKYRGLRGKVVEWIEHKFEEGLLYIHVRFADKTEVCWRIATRMTIEKGDLSNWKSGDFKQLRVFVRNERQEALMPRNIARAFYYLKQEHDRIRSRPQMRRVLDLDRYRRKLERMLDALPRL